MTPIENFAKVDDNLWRGGRPTPEQAAWLVEQGIKSVINLELLREDVPAFGPLMAALYYRHLPDWEPLAVIDPRHTDQHIREFLRAVSELPAPCFCHCRDGQNRTGLAVAAYRLIVKRDPLEDVLADMEAYRGLWADPDADYLRSLATRADAFRNSPS